MICVPKVGRYESPKSYLARFAAENFFLNVGSFLDASDYESLCLSSYLVGHDVKLVQRLLEAKNIFGVDASHVFYEQISGVTAERPYILRGTKIPHRFLETRRARVCPSCVKENRSNLFSTDWRFFNTCPVHQVGLLESCPNCCNEIHWMRCGVHTCPRCEFDLGSYSAIKELRPAEVWLFNLLISGESKKASELVFSLDKLTRFYPNRFFDDGRLLSMLAHLFQGHKQAFTDELATVFEKGVQLPFRFALAPFFLSCPKSSQSLLWDLNQSDELFVGRARRDEVKKIELRSEELLFSCNISRKVIDGLVESGNLVKIVRGRRTRFGLVSVCSLVERLSPPKLSSSKRSHLPINEFKRAVSYYVKQIESGEAEIHRADWSKGFGGIQIFAKSHNPGVSDVAEGVVTVSEFAKLAKVYDDAIRRVVKSGFVTPEVSSGFRKILLFSRSQVEKFIRDYVFISEINKSVGQKPTALSAMLESHGVLAVSGPRIDGALVTLYKRKDVQEINWDHLLAKEFKSKAGRKRNGEVLFDSSLWVGSMEVKKLTGLCPVDISDAVSKGFLSVGVPEGREHVNGRYFSKESVTSFLTKLDEATEVSAVIDELRISKKEFYLRFVDSQFLALLRIGKRKLVLKEDFVAMREDCEKYVSATTADKLTGSPARHFRNLLNTQRIARVTLDQTGSAELIDLVERTLAITIACDLGGRSLSIIKGSV